MNNKSFITLFILLFISLSVFAQPKDEGKEGSDSSSTTSTEEYTTVKEKKALLFFWKSEYKELYDEYIKLAEMYNTRNKELAAINEKLGVYDKDTQKTREIQPNAQEALKKIDSIKARVDELEKATQGGLSKLEEAEKKSANLEAENTKLREKVVELNKELEKVIQLNKELEALRLKFKEYELKIEELEKKLASSEERAKKCLQIDFSDKDVVLFETASHTLSDDGRIALNKVVKIINQKKDKIKHITVVGHTDDVPVNKHKDVYLDNLDLSLKRASTVFRYLKSKTKVELNHFTISGKADSDPIISTPKDDSERSQNRRVEILIELMD